jgi:hypothetical protein
MKQALKTIKHFAIALATVAEFIAIASVALLFVRIVHLNALL